MNKKQKEKNRGQRSFRSDTSRSKEKGKEEMNRKEQKRKGKRSCCGTYAIDPFVVTVPDFYEEKKRKENQEKKERRGKGK